MRSDAQGWASCPDNAFLQALYKGSCTGLQCFEQGQARALVCAGDGDLLAVKCCYMDGSAGMTSCENTDAGLQSVGWMRARKHAFLTGLRKQQGTQLSSITAAKQCRYLANP
jgi:hypothetical protein